MLEARGIGVAFQGVQALSDVDLLLEPREILGLIGPNGAGKTTLVNVLSGFHRPSAGAVMLDAADVSAWSPDRRARGGMIRTFQGLRFFRALTVFENVLAACFATGMSRSEARARTEHCLTLLGLWERRDDRADALPFGDERRLEIARAISGRPRYLLLDEPAAGLNELESRELVETIRVVRDELACGVLLIEHDMSVIMGVSERIHVLNYGRTIVTGTPEAIRENEDVITAYLGRVAADA